MPHLRQFFQGQFIDIGLFLGLRFFHDNPLDLDAGPAGQSPVQGRPNRADQVVRQRIPALGKAQVHFDGIPVGPDIGDHTQIHEVAVALSRVPDLADQV